MPKKNKPTKEHKDHWDRVAEIGCILTGKPAQLHHCKGGSMKVAFPVGGSQKQSHWLVLPLHVEFHTGDNGIHQIGVDTWEERYGSQVELLDRLSHMLNMDVFEKVLGERGIE